MAIKTARLESAQHILLKVLMNDYNAEQIAYQPYNDKIRLEVKCPVDLASIDKSVFEDKINSVINRNLDVSENNYKRNEVPKNVDLSLVPEQVEEIRVISIGDFDSQPCHELHVQNTSEIGKYELLELKRHGKDTYRFVSTVKDL